MVKLATAPDGHKQHGLGRLDGQTGIGVQAGTFELRHVLNWRYSISQLLEKAGNMNRINEAGWDRVLRVISGIALLDLGWTGVVRGR